MANNLFIGENAVACKADTSFAAAGVTGANVAIIYEIGNPNKSYVPGRLINSLTGGFTLNKGYYIVMLANADWTEFMVPPVTASGNITPAAPTAGVVDNTANTFNWTNSTGFTALSDYEFTLNGGSSYANVTAKPIVVGDIAKAAGQVGVRVKAATGRNVSATLFNTTAFTVAGGTGSIIYEDTFNAADDPEIEGRTPTTVPSVSPLNWQKVAGGTGALAIAGNALAPAEVGSSVKYFINHPVRDIDLRYTIQGLSSPSDGAGFSYWAMFAYLNATNYFQVALKNGEAYKVINGTPTQLYAGSGLSAAGDVMRIVLNGTSLKIYRNATLLQDVTVSASELVGTGHGILADQPGLTDKIDQFTSLTV